MQRRVFLQQSSAVVAAGTLAPPARAQGLPEVRWRLQSNSAKSLDLIHASVVAMSERVQAMTAGKFRIEIFGRDEIVAGGQLLEALGAGKLEAGHVDANTLLDRDPAFACFSAMPFGLTARQHDAWLLHGGGLPALHAALKSHRVTGFPAGSAGVRMGGWFRRELKAVADFAGLKVWTSSRLDGAVLARLGAVPQRVPDGEVAAALAAGRLDGATWIGPYDDEKQGFHKAAKFYFYPMGAGAENRFVVLVGLDAWAALPEAHRAAFEAACIAAGVELRARYDALNPRALRALLANGVQLRPYPPEIARAGLLAADEVVAETLAASEGFRQIHPGWKNFRDDQIRAFGLAEARVQGFMHSAVVAPGTASRK